MNHNMTFYMAGSGNSWDGSQSQLGWLRYVRPLSTLSLVLHQYAPEQGMNSLC